MEGTKRLDVVQVFSDSFITVTWHWEKMTERNYKKKFQTVTIKVIVEDRWGVASTY